MWRGNTVRNIDVCWSLQPKAYWASISSPPWCLQEPVNHRLIHIIRPAMIKNTSFLTMWLKWHPDEAIAQYADWPSPGSIWIHRLNHQRTGGKLIQISMITTTTQWRITVHCGSRTSPTGSANSSNRTQSTLISPSWHSTLSLSYHTVLEWRPVFPLHEMLSAGGSRRQKLRSFAEKSLSSRLIEPLTRSWEVFTQHWIWQTPKTTGKRHNTWRKDNCTERPRSMTFWRCGRAAKTYLLHRRNLMLKIHRWQP